MRAPDFWSRRGPLAVLLAPFGWLYAAGGWFRFRLADPVRAPVPVVCVGNLVAGGAGKTPAVLALATILRERSPHALTRGYGGNLAGPLRVDPARHCADEVGDEPLLLARRLPTWVSRDRVAGAMAAAQAGAGLILMDDGFQNPALAKDVSFLVVDSAQGFGNRHCLPAGPLREPSRRGLARADAVLLLGDGVFDLAYDGPIFRAHLRPSEDADAWQGRPVVAFAGIGRPEKFFASLAAAGADIRSRHAFADHHRYSDSDLAMLSEQAGQTAALVTTEKDYVRVPPGWQNRVKTWPVALQFEDGDGLSAWLRGKLGGSA